MADFGGKCAFTVFLVFLISIQVGFSGQAQSPGDIFKKSPRILPGDLLYGPKIALEHASIALSLDRAEKCLDLMDVRLSEFSKMARLNRTDGLDRLSLEYSFLSETYQSLPEKAPSFSRHARNLEILSDSLSKANAYLSEKDRLLFSSFLGSISRKAALAGKIVERESFFSPLRLTAERDLALARTAVSEKEFLSNSSLPELRASLKTAEILLREGEYLSSSIVSLGILEKSQVS